MWRALVVPRDIQDKISDEMRWIDFTRNDTHISLVSFKPGSSRYTFTVAALLPWNRNRRPIKRKN